MSYDRVVLLFDTQLLKRACLDLPIMVEIVEIESLNTQKTKFLQKSGPIFIVLAFDTYHLKLKKRRRKSNSVVVQKVAGQS